MSAPTSITNSPCHSAFEWQRKRRRSSVDEESKSAKRMRYFYILASESSDELSDDGTESIYSVQEKETDYAKDTSDTDTKSEMSDEYDLRVEYDVVSTSEEENMFTDGSSSGNDAALLAAGAVAASICEERSLEAWVTDGDDETDSSTSDFEEQPADYQKCRMCKTRETVSCFPLCSHCHQIRKTYFPPRPRKNRRKQETSSMTSSQVTTDSLRSCLSGLSSSQSSQESGIGSSQELQPLAWDKVIVPENLISKAPDLEKSTNEPKSGSNQTPIMNNLKSSDESKSSSSEASDSSDMKILKEQKSSLEADLKNEPKSEYTSFDNGWSDWALATKEMCIMCNERPKNGIFLHSSGAHMCCCYKCAVKYWNQSKRCAYCNRKVKNVVKAFVV